MSSLKASCSLLENSVASLDIGIHDFPRMSKVLQANRHFDIVGETDVLNAHHALSDEIQPQIDELLRRADAELARLERKERGLSSKSDLQQVRLQQRPSTRIHAPNLSSPADGTAASEEDSIANAEKYKSLRAKRERLQFSLDRMKLEVEQKHRQMRSGTAHA